VKRTDEQIKTDIVNSLSSDIRIDAADVGVKVNEGVVTLTGTVPSYNAKLAAYEKARETRNTISVDNQLSVVYSSNVVKPSDDELESNAKNVLSWNLDIDKSKVEVSSDSGIVKLKGTVNWYSHRHKAEELVSSLIGVFDVKNELAVVPTEMVADELIAKNIMEELGLSSYFEASIVLVEVADGAVTLTGMVRNHAAKNHAYNVAAHTAGVVEIVNNINFLLR
jgi:osmotically-inducible protein OsmY